MDSSAARSLMKRQGVQKTRHIATGLLWVQDKVADGELGVKPVAGQRNPSDLGTKAHSTKRLHYLMSLLGFEKGIGENKSFEESHVQTGNIRRLKRLLPFILATLSPHGANGHDSYGSNEELEIKNETCSEPTYVVENWKKKILELLWYCGVSLAWTAIFVGLCWLRDRLYPRGPRHWSEEAIREDRERRDEEARRTMEYYSSFDYHMFDDDEDYTTTATKKVKKIGATIRIPSSTGMNKEETQQIGKPVDGMTTRKKNGGNGMKRMDGITRRKLKRTW